MSCVDFEIPEQWFAWRPVFTRDAGWVWCRTVWRQRWSNCHMSWWSYRVALVDRLVEYSGAEPAAPDPEGQ
jgi:hypothetical protein